MKRMAPAPGDVFGLLHPFSDAHTLGLASVAQLLEDCGYRAVIGGEDLCRAVEAIRLPEHAAKVRQWIEQRSIAHLGFSFRLDPGAGATRFEELVHFLRAHGLLAEAGGPVRGLFFAGLPATCKRVARALGDRVQTFDGSETPRETLIKFGLSPRSLPSEYLAEDEYDESRRQFASDMLNREVPDRIAPFAHHDYPEFGSRRDTLIARLKSARNRGILPLMRAHVGPYHADRELAVEQFRDWCARLADDGFLDVLSIGTSQLTQSHFGLDWSGLPNGGGVPIQNEAEYVSVYEASRPMLLRTYAGTRLVNRMAVLHERTLNMAWHALSLWWFSRIDGRGPNDVLTNLRQHFRTLAFISKVSKPFEPNIPHHFAFRGADDVTYVASGVLAAGAAKRVGIRYLVLQNMLNTPRSTWGIQDLAKARVLLRLVREMEDSSFRVVYQPRAGLDYFSSDPNVARCQLAAVSALMDDVEPGNDNSPDVVHVVSYSEGYELANPDVVNESVRITRAAIGEYREARKRGRAFDVGSSKLLAERTAQLEHEVRLVMKAMEQSIPDLYSPMGLYIALWAGFFPVPYLWECRDEFAHATTWKTRVDRGMVRVVDDDGRFISTAERLALASEAARRFREPSGANGQALTLSEN